MFFAHEKTSLMIENAIYNDSTFLQLCNEIKNSKLIRLKISNVQLSSERMQQLCQALPNTLQRLDFSCNQLTTNFITDNADEFKRLKHLEEFDLTFNELSDDVLACLKELCELNMKLTISVHHNNVSAAYLQQQLSRRGIDILFNQLRHS